jgi:NTP pyrophosphohydrolases including oxidative damage repair enzymes
MLVWSGARIDKMSKSLRTKQSAMKKMIHISGNRRNKQVFSTPWFSVITEPCREKDSKPYYVIEVPDSVVILAVTPDDEMILVRQYRQPLRAYSIELPAGYVDKNESNLKAAKRELKEETEYCCRTGWFEGVPEQGALQDTLLFWNYGRKKGKFSRAGNRAARGCQEHV